MLVCCLVWYNTTNSSCSQGDQCLPSESLLYQIELHFVFSWNHAFKNQITTLQGQAKNRANPNRSEVQANLSLFLEAASGFYTQVSFALCMNSPCFSGSQFFVHFFFFFKQVSTINCHMRHLKVDHT